MTLIDLGQFARAHKALEYEAPSVTHVAARGALLAARIARLLGSSPAADLQRARDFLARGDDYYIGALLALERAESIDAHQALDLCEAELRAAESREYGGIAMKARLLAARAALHAGDTAAARRALERPGGTPADAACGRLLPADRGGDRSRNPPRQWRGGARGRRFSRPPSPGSTRPRRRTFRMHSATASSTAIPSIARC